MLHYNKDIPTVVMPLIKKVTPTARKQSVPATPSITVSKETKVQPTPVQKNNIKAVTDPVIAAPLIAPKNKKTTTKEKKKEKAPAAPEKADKTVPAEKKVTAIKTAPEKTTVPPETQKEIPKEVPITSADTAEPTDAVVYIGRHDAQAQQLYDAVYEAVRIVWAPPPGFGSEVKAQVEIVLNWDGKLEKYTLLQSSGVPIFDACVRRDSKKIEFPKGAWGKTWILTFSNDTKVIYE